MFRRTFLLVLVALIAACSSASPALLTDQQVIEKFTAHKEAFIRLVEVVTADPRVASVDLEPDGSYRASPGGVPKSKIDQVVADVKVLGLQYIGVPPRSGQGRYVQFGISAVGISVSGSAKSLVYSEGPVEGDAVSDTDAQRPSNGMQIVHRKIAENWYIQKISN